MKAAEEGRVLLPLTKKRGKPAISVAAPGVRRGRLQFVSERNRWTYNLVVTATGGGLARKITDLEIQQILSALIAGGALGDPQPAVFLDRDCSRLCSQCKRAKHYLSY